MQVSTVTQRAATTTWHHHTETLSGDTYQPVYLPRPAKREGREGKGETATQMHNLVLEMHELPEQVHVI